VAVEHEAQPEPPAEGANGPVGTAENALGRVQRWLGFGGAWRVVSRTAGTVTISLCRCDEGEEMDRLISDDPELLAWLGGRTSSEQ
jgi:hypothetical protein